MTRAWFVSAAYADVEAAHQWYESWRVGLGAEFIGAVDAAVAAVLDHPEAYPITYRDARRYLLGRFPYGLYYRIEGNGVIVVACMHAACDPVRYRRRLRD